MRIGTRGSALALAQAQSVASRLSGPCEVVPIATAGDRAERLGDKSRWVSGLELALLEGAVDVAVHSAKDVPAELAEGLALVAVPPREDARDAICGARALSALPAGARVGTSSLRRRAQLLSLREDLVVVPLRGNVDTRLRKLAAGEVDALVLALAGLRRLGREDAADGVLDELVPAAGQGALVLEARSDLTDDRRFEGVRDEDAWACVMAERELTRALGASCQTAVGAHARRLGDGVVELSGWVGRPDGSAWISDHRVGHGPDVGKRVAEAMLAAGAAELMAAGVAELMAEGAGELMAEGAAERAPAAPQSRGAAGDR
jgi:hydroxymethylbilane synthase